jgi:endonuclease G, mitochondrial
MHELSEVRSSAPKLELLRIPTFSNLTPDRINVVVRASSQTRATRPGFERIVGESDLTSINDLDRGRRIAASVRGISLALDCEWHGTGLAAASLLVGQQLRQRKGDHHPGQPIFVVEDV